MKSRRETSPIRRFPQQRRSRETVEAVLDAVARIVKREGVKSVSTNRVAEVAGVSIGSVYQYFPDKRAIYVALHKRHLEEIDRRVTTTLTDNAGASLEDMIRALVAVLIAAHTPDREMYNLLFSEIPHQAEGTQDFSVRLHGVFHLALASRVREMKRSRDLHKKAFVVSNMIEALSHGTALRRPATISLKEAQEEIVSVVLAYLRT